MNVRAIRTRVFKEGDDLVKFIKENVPRLPDGAVLAVTSKIAALSERRTARIEDKARLVKEESDWAMKTKYVWLTVRQGLVMASAGIDESNSNGRITLLPRDSFALAARLRRELMRTYRIKRLGVIITDSRIFPLRSGIVGVAIGYAGFKGIKDYTGTPDIFGRKFHFSKVDIADSVATAAVLAMGEGSERRPLSVVTGAPVTFVDRVYRRELFIDIKNDVYRPLFENAKSIRQKKRA